MRAEPIIQQPDLTESSTPVDILRVTAGAARPDTDAVAAEEPLAIRLAWTEKGLPHRQTVAVTMRTPGADGALAAGFLYTEAIIGSPDDVASIAPPVLPAAGLPPNTIDVTLAPGRTPRLRPVERNFYVSSSCGVCGKSALDALITARPHYRTAPELRVAPATLAQLPDTLRAAQQVFDQTGGLHAAACFAPDGTLRLVREDVGRHNALDKLIGTLLLARQLPADDCIILVSGRASFELVQKAAMAGVQLLAAVSAPSSLAVQTADAAGLTLVGFLRGTRFNIYTHTNCILTTAAPP